MTGTMLGEPAWFTRYREQVNERIAQLEHTADAQDAHIVELEESVTALVQELREERAKRSPAASPAEAAAPGRRSQTATASHGGPRTPRLPIRRAPDRGGATGAPRTARSPRPATTPRRAGVPRTASPRARSNSCINKRLDAHLLCWCLGVACSRDKSLRRYLTILSPVNTRWHRAVTSMLQWKLEASIQTEQQLQGEGSVVQMNIKFEEGKEQVKYLDKRGMSELASLASPPAAISDICLAALMLVGTLPVCTEELSCVYWAKAWKGATQHLRLLPASLLDLTPEAVLDTQKIEVVKRVLAQWTEDELKSRSSSAALLWEVLSSMASAADQVTNPDAVRELARLQDEMLPQLRRVVLIKTLPEELRHKFLKGDISQFLQSASDLSLIHISEPTRPY
eukprot:TRINITY_DN3657_c0_g2_i3.p1 TRINITY_DN3657_c0_g2~~TRINITY_DN3657_c0_g2_i3.p1  ORF type:complete len:397 (+),score=65.81 TRINITY_DN3657_c0_g2_i3:219-1409(+)